MARLRVDPLIGGERYVDGLLADPWFAGLMHDDATPGYIDHPLLSYHLASVEGVPCGVFIDIAYSALETEVHAALTKVALPFARELGAIFIEQQFQRPKVERLTAHVLADLASAANYCRRLGFVDEGFRRNSASRNGRLLGVLTLGLTREDWNAGGCPEFHIEGSRERPR